MTTRRRRRRRRWPLYSCSACGEETTQLAGLEKRYYCMDCYKELAFGIITNQNIHFFGGTSSGRHHSNPWLENAVRAYEETRSDLP